MDRGREKTGEDKPSEANHGEANVIVQFSAIFYRVLAEAATLIAEVYLIYYYYLSTAVFDSREIHPWTFRAFCTRWEIQE